MKLDKLAKSITMASALALGVISAVPAAAETKGPVTDPIGVVELAPGAPIWIGGMWVLSGPDTALGLDEQRAVEIAFDDYHHKIVGHPIRFVTEDTQCTAEGGQTAATKLASNQNILVVIGPACSSVATPAAPILWKAGIPMIGTASTAPALTAANRPAGYDGFLRTIYSDAMEGPLDARYFYKVLGCRTMATIHDESPYATQLAAVARKHFKELGGKIVASEAVQSTDVDMHPVLTRIATAKPCVLYFPIFVAAAAQIARQVKDIPGLSHTHIYGGSALMAPGFIAAAGDAAVGFKFNNPDTSLAAHGAGYPAFVKKYQEKFGEPPIQAFNANAYDGAMITLRAIKKVAKTDAKGNTYIGRMALRNALFATKGYQGLSGTITCNKHGECGSFKFSVYEFTNSDPNTFKIGVNPKKIYPKS